MEFDKAEDEKSSSKLIFTRSRINRKLIIVSVLIVFAVVLSFVVGYLVRRAVHKPKCSMGSEAVVQTLKQKENIWKSILQRISAGKIDENLKYLSAAPHVAASPRNNELAAEIERRFKGYGFDVEKPQYNVLLSYPKQSKPNYAYIVDDKDAVQFKTQLREKGKLPGENISNVVQPFNAFSPAGIVNGDLVYVNFGSDEDFKVLKDHFKVNCSGKIVITRYGKIYRGDKVFNAQKNGAIGILIYNDPINYGPVSQKYPKSLWLPGDGVQRGTINKADGDSLTPGWPSTDDAFRLATSKAEGMPKIPCHPISSNDAFQFLRKMGGPSVGFKNWTGGLNITYKVGPGFAFPSSGWKVKIEVNNELQTKRITNVIGTVRGSLEPDRYVMIGNHRDAWVFGGVDASSGGSVVLELARVVAEKMKTGWRPARSIKFCSWDGEESGLIGSVEYVEQNVKLLVQRAVAYINLDTAVFGNYSLNIAGSPLLYEAIYDSLKKVQDPTEGSTTMFQKTVRVSPAKSDPTKPRISRIGGGSDYYHFYNMAAVPSIDLQYGMQQVHKKFGQTTYYPVYHSLYDTYYWMKTFIDPKFMIHRAVAEFSGRLLLQLSDAPVLPLEPRDYSAALLKGANDIKRILHQKNASAFNVSTAYLFKSIASFTKAADAFHSSLSSIDKSNVLRLRMINDQLLLLEKGFILAPGLPNRPTVRHIAFSLSSHNSYGSSAFPGVTDLLYEIEQKKQDWDSLKKHLTIIATTIEGVAASLKNLW